MNPLRTVVTVIWRIWFYILMALPIIIMLPFLIVFTSSEKFYPQFFVCARIWAKAILYGMGFYPKVKDISNLKDDKSYMFIANHTSIIDIMLMLAVIDHPFVFVGKVELAKIPLFGYFYKRTCILVDRNSQKSRMQVFESAQRRINQGNSICIFPEGGVPNDKSKVLTPFKDGAFRLAIDHQLALVPITFHDNKKRFSYTFLSGSPGKMRVKIDPVISVAGKSQADKRELKDKAFQTILKELENPSL